MDARLDQAALNYEKTFLLALEDVENAFVAHTTSKEEKSSFRMPKSPLKKPTSILMPYKSGALKITYPCLMPGTIH